MTAPVVADPWKGWREWRRVNRPRMRRATPVGLVSSGSRRRVYECVCGASETCSNQWPVTKRVADFVRQHEIACDPSRKGA